jgi:hypothetical protein
MIAKLSLLSGAKWLVPFGFILAGLGLVSLAARGLITLFPKLPARESEGVPLEGDLEDLRARYARGELSEAEFSAASSMAHVMG